MAQPVLATLLATLLPLAVQAAPAALPTTLPSLAMPANGDLVLSDTLTGRWTVTEVAGTTIPQGAQVTLQFGAEGGLAGTSGCNSFSARLTVGGADLVIAHPGATRMACAADLMALEAGFNRALDGVRRFEIAADGTLALHGEQMLLMRAVRE